MVHYITVVLLLIACSEIAVYVTPRTLNAAEIPRARANVDKEAQATLAKGLSCITCIRTGVYALLDLEFYWKNLSEFNNGSPDIMESIESKIGEIVPSSIEVFELGSSDPNDRKPTYTDLD
ncbi:hypothetical protein QBC45DRAFT_436202 [Copromyces sp. CBS 386.78]|nr:hypothetical protein QBC45DRAFT_436202 [Copromyces sp. CBS 386.78]